MRSEKPRLALRGEVPADLHDTVSLAKGSVPKAICLRKRKIIPKDRDSEMPSYLKATCLTIRSPALARRWHPFGARLSNDD